MGFQTHISPVDSQSASWKNNTDKMKLYKVFENNEDPYLVLLSIPSAYGSSNKTTPATLFFNRTVRKIIPSVTETSNLKKSYQPTKISSRFKKALTRTST